MILEKVAKLWKRWLKNTPRPNSTYSDADVPGAIALALSLTHTNTTALSTSAVAYLYFWSLVPKQAMPSAVRVATIA